MSTNFPTSLDDTTTMPVVVDNQTNVLASHHNNQSDALQAVETKLGTGASTATDGKFLVGNTTAGSSQWRVIAAADVPDISATYAPAAKGVTNGDSHDHSGGDGAQIPYSSLSGTPTIPTKATGAEVDTGTDDVKFVTSKAMTDSSYVKSSDNIATASNIANNTGTTTTVLHGNASGSPAFGPVLEADLSLSNNTTGNVSTTMHGFAPKLSDVAGQYLDGKGNWSTPAGSGDVLGPASNTADYLPQWNGADSKTLKNGLAVPTGGLAGLTSPVFTTPQINDTSADHQYITAVSELTADRTVTLPLLTGNDEFVFKDHTQTLANKTFTTPVLNGAITGDAIATGATINTGTANDDIVTSKAIKDANILTQAWTTYTPSTANITKGSGTLVGAYTRLGNTVWFRIKFILAADSAVGTAPTFSLPVTASSSSTGNNSSLRASYTDSGTAIYQGFVEFASSTTVKPWAINTAGTYAIYAGITASVPITWTTNDVIEITGLYEAA